MNVSSNSSKKCFCLASAVKIAMIAQHCKGKLGGIICLEVPPTETQHLSADPRPQIQGDISMNRQQNLFPPKCQIALFVAMLMLAGSILAVGQTETVVHRFQGGSDGLDPIGGLISDSAGNFYGTTCGDGS